jgi:hypothetical protein
MLQQLTNWFLNGASALIQQVRERLAAQFGRKPTPEPSPPERPDPELLEAANRRERRRLEALRRKYEKARLRHDKFVEPQGEPPTPHVRADSNHPPQPEPKPEPEPEPDDDYVPDAFDIIGGEKKLIVDRHHEVGDRVLYRPEEFEGQFTFRDTILEQLDRYWVYLRRMRKHDPGAYDFYRQVGIVTLPYCSLGTWRDWNNGKITFKMKLADCETELPGWFLKNRPGFGCVSYGTNPLTEFNEIDHTLRIREQKHDKHTMLYSPKFMYFVKYSRPPADFQPMSGGDTYKLTVWWDRPQDPKAWRRKYGIPQDFGMFVSRDGTRIRALKVYDHDVDTYWRDWHIPHHMEDWAKQHGLSAQRYLTHIFIQAVKAYGQLDMSMVQIRVEKDDMAATFAVKQDRLSYFFKDRDYVLTSNGSRRRIFHVVKPHMRMGVIPIKMHFRGERQFTWAGYKVLVSVPGYHHTPLTEISIASEDWDGRGGGDKVGSAELGAALADHIRTGKFDALKRAAKDDE